jgi:3-hydroxyisobutyrate dehydrogenase-like beta-hydroxyacid dehydrogenase
MVAAALTPSEPAPVRTVAVCGTGRMGGTMVGRIRGGGFDVVVWNRDRAKAEAVAARHDARVAGSAAEAASAADVVITSLADDEAVRRVVPSLAEGLRAGTVVLEMSTIAPATVREVAPAVVATGAAFCDTPVSGSVPTVESGQIVIMAGGDSDAIERARPVLDTFAKKVVHLGELGAGATTKLAVNSLVHGLGVALAEALVLAERAGVDRSAAYEVFASGAAGAPFVQYKRPAFERPDETPVAFSLDLVAKDLDLIIALGEEVGLPMDQARTNRDEIRAAIAAGLGEKDMSTLAVHLRGR